MNISKLSLYLNNTFLTLVLVFAFGCNHNNQNISNQTETAKEIDFNALKSNLYDNLTADILNSSPLKDSLSHLDSAIIYVIPVKKCFMCLHESLMKINTDSSTNSLKKIIVTVQDSVADASKETNLQIHKNFIHIILQDNFSSKYNLLEICRIYYNKNSKSTIDIL